MAEPIVLFGGLLLVLFVLYKLNVEGFSHRVPASHLLSAAEAYNLRPQDSAYHQKWNFVV